MALRYSDNTYHLPLQVGTVKNTLVILNIVKDLLLNPSTALVKDPSLRSG